MRFLRRHPYTAAWVGIVAAASSAAVVILNWTVMV